MPSAKAPQGVPTERDPHFECNCVPDLGPPHCHGCSQEAGSPMTWEDAGCRPCGKTAPKQRVSVLDVAAYVLRKAGPMTHMKLQRLVYYCQGWHLAWTGVPLFPERIEAWANGPVVPVLYEALRGEFRVDEALLQARLADPEASARVRAQLKKEGLAP